jgi:hypothetical protein
VFNCISAEATAELQRLEEEVRQLAGSGPCARRIAASALPSKLVRQATLKVVADL